MTWKVPMEELVTGMRDACIKDLVEGYSTNPAPKMSVIKIVYDDPETGVDFQTAPIMDRSEQEKAASLIIARGLIGVKRADIACVILSGWVKDDGAVVTRLDSGDADQGAAECVVVHVITRCGQSSGALLAVDKDDGGKASLTKAYEWGKDNAPESLYENLFVPPTEEERKNILRPYLIEKANSLGFGDMVKGLFDAVDRGYAGPISDVESSVTQRTIH